MWLSVFLAGVARRHHLPGPRRVPHRAVPDRQPRPGGRAAHRRRAARRHRRAARRWARCSTGDWPHGSVMALLASAQVARRRRSSCAGTPRPPTASSRTSTRDGPPCQPPDATCGSGSARRIAELARERCTGAASSRSLPSGSACRRMAGSTRAGAPWARPGSRHRVRGNDAAPRARRQRGSFTARSRRRLAGLRTARAASGPSCCCRSRPRCWPSPSASTSPGRCSPPTEGTPKMRRSPLAIQEGASAYLKRQFRTIAVILVPVAADRVLHVDGDHQARRQSTALTLRPVRAVPHASPSSSAAWHRGSPATSA